MDDILTPVSVGELLDKVTILEIKSARISDVSKLENIHRELAALQAVCEKHIQPNADISELKNQLYLVNTQLWDIEDDIRECERNNDFGAKFIELARAVYVTNDQRAGLKRQINQALGSRLTEEKSYADYRQGALGADSKL